MSEPIYTVAVEVPSNAGELMVIHSRPLSFSEATTLCERYKVHGHRALLLADGMPI